MMEMTEKIVTVNEYCLKQTVDEKDSTIFISAFVCTEDSTDKIKQLYPYGE